MRQEKRLVVVGGGIAGAMLALRWCELEAAALEVVVWPPDGCTDATAASGGMVRGFERDLDDCRLAAASIAELHDGSWPAASTGYRRTGSTYLLPPGTDPGAQLDILDRARPGSVRVVPGDEAAHRIGLTARPAGTLAIVERDAGYLSPGTLRDWALARAVHHGTKLIHKRVIEIGEGPVLTFSDGTRRRYDGVVLAVGAWTSALLPGMTGLRTRRIQYGLYPMSPRVSDCFVDESSTLYGRPHDGGMLLGVATNAWGVGPADARPSQADTDRVAQAMRAHFAPPRQHAQPIRTVAAVDCFADGGLRLRPVEPLPMVFTFTGGSGGAAKTVLAASRQAARQLLKALSHNDTDADLEKHCAPARGLGNR